MEQDAHSDQCTPERLPASDSATALRHKIPDLQTEDGGDYVIAAHATGYNCPMWRITAFLATHGRKVEPATTKMTET